MSNTKTTPTSDGGAQHHRTLIGQAQRVKTRARIIECAIPVFAERGPDAPVIDDFAKAAGVSRSTFYTYFQTTRELLDATMATLSNEVIASILPLVTNETDPIVRLAVASWMYYRRATANPMLGAFLGSVSNIGPLASERTRHDLGAAIECRETGITDLDHAEGIAHGIMIASVRTTRPGVDEDKRALTVISATLAALGVSSTLIEQALSKIQQIGKE